MLLLLLKILTTFYGLTYLGEDFWDLYLRGFRPSNYFDVDFDSYTVDPGQLASNHERELDVAKLRKDRTKKLKAILKLKSHFGHKENFINEPDDDNEVGIVNYNVLPVSFDIQIVSQKYLFKYLY